MSFNTCISKLAFMESILSCIVLNGPVLYYIIIILLHCVAFSAGICIRLRSTTGCSNVTHQITLQKSYLLDVIDKVDQWVA